MGSSSSKPRPYPLLNPGFNVPYGQNPNLYLPPHLQQPQNSSPNKKKRKSKRNGSVSDQEKIAQAYVQGWHAGQTGMGPVIPHQPVVPRQSENTRPVIPPAPVAPTIVAQPTQTPFTGSTFAVPHQQPQTQAQAPQQFVQPQAPLQERANPDIARVLQPLPPPNPAVFGPPPLQQPPPPLANPLPTPPRDLYELSPYNTLLNLPQTTALLTAAYSQQGGLPPSYGRRRGNRTGGLLRALTGRGRKEEDVHFVPVFINGQPPPPANSIPRAAAGFGAPAPAPVVVDPAAAPPPPIILQDTPQFPVPQQTFSDGRQSTSAPAPIRFSNSTPQYFAFLNYSPHRVVFNNAEYPTAMHLHEAMKFLPNNPSFAERIRTCPDVQQVYPLSEELADRDPTSVREDWSAAYLPSMEQVIFNKFTLHANLRDMLLRTGDAPLIYADDQDPYWGEGPPGRGGYNHLGHILERVRAEIRREGGLA